MIEIRYIGRKKWAIDSVANTGTVWDGKDDVKPVSVNAARKLLRHADEWELANPEDSGRLEVHTAHQTTDETGKLVEVDEADLRQPIEKMNRAELKVYAKTKFNRDLSAQMSKAHMIDAVEEFEKTLNQVNTLVPDLDETPAV